MKSIMAAVLAAGACASSLQAQSNARAATRPVLTLEEALTEAGASSPAIEAAPMPTRALGRFAGMTRPCAAGA